MRLGMVVAALMALAVFCAGCQAFKGGPKKTAYVKEHVSQNEFFLKALTDIREKPEASAKVVGVFKKGSSVVATETTDDKTWTKIRAAHYDEKVYEGWVPTASLSKTR
ncbi:MAG: SH3 domain-containing protein [Desulfovibrionaceae bacterium]|nr:SH3 domain-containing protein [Desulfovibrionaceae bacterium]